VPGSATQRPVVKRPSRRWLKLLLFPVAVLAGAILFLNSRFAWDQGCALARRELPSLLGMNIGIGRCELDPLAQTVKLYAISASAPEGQGGPTFAAEAVEVHISSLRPLFRKVDLDSVHVLRPRFDLTLTRSEPAPATKVGPCPFDALARTHIGKLEITGGAITARFPDGQRVEVTDVGVTWLEEHGIAQFEVLAGGGVVELTQSRELPVAKFQLSGILSVEEQRLEISRAQLNVAGSTMSLTGRVDQLCRPRLALDGRISLPLETLVEAGILRGPADGKIAVRTRISGSPSAPTLSARIVGSQAQVRQYRPGDFETRLSYAENELTLDELILKAGDGVAKISGSIKLQRHLPARFKADIERAEFGRILEMAGLPGAWVNFSADGRVNVSGHLSPSLQLSGEADINTANFIFATRAFDAPAHSGKPILAFDQGHVALNVRFLSDRVEMQHARIEAGRSQVNADATLFYQASRGLVIKGTADPLVLSDFRRVAGLDADGVGYAQLEIAGPYADVHLESSTSFRDLDFWYFSLGAVRGNIRYQKKVLTFAGLAGQKGKTPYTGSGELRFGPELHTTWDVLVPAGRTEDIIDAIAGLHPSIELFQGTSTGDASGAVHINSAVSRLTGNIEFDLKDTRYYERRLGDGHVAIRFVNGESMILDRATLAGPLATMSASGTYSFDGPLSYRFRADNLSLSELAGTAISRKLGLTGTATLVGKVAGDATTPEVSAYLHSPQVNIGERGSSEGHLEARVLGRQLEVWGRPFKDARVSASFTLREPYPFRASLALALQEIRPLLPPGAVAQGLSGGIEGSISAKGNMLDRHSLDVQARFDKLRLSRGDFSGENDGPIAFSYQGDRFELQTVTFRGPNTELTLGGSYGPTQVDAKLDGSLDVRLLESFIPALERSGGRVLVSAAATGSVNDPSILGSAEVRDARLSLRDFPMSVKGLSGRVEFSEARLLVQDMHGILNDGRVLVRGNVALRRLGLQSIEMIAQLDEVAWRLREYLPVTLSGELSLVGKPEAMVLSGDLDVIKLRYDQPLIIESFLTQLRSAPGIYLSERRDEWLSFDVGIHAKGDVRVENNLARAKLAGDVRLTGTNASPGLIGTIQALEGSQAFFRGNQFAVRQGVLEFKDRRSIDPVFDLQAETQVREYLVRLHAFGRANDPKLILSAEPELSEGDILSLLTLGITSRDKSNTAGTSAGLAAEALFTASGLDRQVQRFLPKNPVLRDFALRISTSYNDVTYVVEPTWQFESKFLTEQLKLRYTQPFSGRGRKAEAEYFLDERISTQAQWDDAYTYIGTSSVLSTLGNLGLNLKLHWEVG
jgi:translocation and assembly module TamB